MKSVFYLVVGVMVTGCVTQRVPTMNDGPDWLVAFDAGNIKENSILSDKDENVLEKIDIASSISRSLEKNTATNETGGGNYSSYTSDVVGGGISLATILKGNVMLGSVMALNSGGCRECDAANGISYGAKNTFGKPAGVAFTGSIDAINLRDALSTSISTFRPIMSKAGCEPIKNVMGFVPYSDLSDYFVGYYVCKQTDEMNKSNFPSDRISSVADIVWLEKGYEGVLVIKKNKDVPNSFDVSWYSRCGRMSDDLWRRHELSEQWSLNSSNLNSKADFMNSCKDAFNGVNIPPGWIQYTTEMVNEKVQVVTKGKFNQTFESPIQSGNW